MQRRLTTTRVACAVIAPALIPRKPGERIKTDRRDARKLAELWRAGLLTEVRPPTPADEAGDLCRARDDARIGNAVAPDGQVAPAPRLALRRAELDAGASALDSHGSTRPNGSWWMTIFDHLDARLGELDAQLTAIAATAPYQDAVGWLRCFRGIETLTAMMRCWPSCTTFGGFRRRAPCGRISGSCRGNTPAASGGGHHQDRQHPGASTVVESIIAIAPAWGTRWRGAGAANRDASRDRGQGATAVVSALPYPHRPADARPEGHGGDRARTGRLRVGGAAARASRGEQLIPEEESTPGALGPGREDDG